ncbi:MAG: cell surface protein SprA, partial [Paludibacteraceae bacterium]|nr:cell surface protein SprA [Paludibacteraceae bacterium]
VKWYQFKVPIRNYSEKVGSIRNFKSIRFVRLFLTGFEQETHLRIGTMDLVRGEWRSYTKPLYRPERPPITNGTLDVQAVNYEENSTKSPVNYVLPPGVSRQTDPGQMQIIQQNEQAMVLRVNNLAPGDARAVYKATGYDMRMYKRLQMFVHAEKMPDDTHNLEDYDLSCFIRLGSDMVNNYYEYEIPMKLTEHGTYQNDKTSDREAVWSPENMFDFSFEALTNAKLQRNKAKRNGTSNVSNSIPYSIYDEENNRNKITVVGNPTLEEVENIMIGIRNRDDEVKTGEIWVNELRMSEFDESGGWAAMANMALGLSDIAQVNVAGRIETAGFGGIESNMLNRRMEDQYQVSVSAALEAGRLFPEKAKLQIPLYYSYTNETLSPKYNPLDTDVELKDALDVLETKEEKDSLKAMSQTVATSHNFSLSGAKVNIKSKKQPMFYDPANFSISYSYNRQETHDAEIEKNMQKEHRGSLTYSFNFNPKPWEPFKDNKALSKKGYKIIKDFNIYYLPQSWSFNTDIYRTFSQMSLRNFNTADTGSEPMDLTFSKEFMWNRNFDIKYDLSKTMKFSLQTAMNSNIEEAYFTPEIGKEYYEAWRDTVMASIAKLGSPYTYQQVFTASWALPINKIPFLEWITANGSYNATYSWNRTADLQGGLSLGNVVSSMASWQVDGQLNMELLYNKSKYLKSVNQRYSTRGAAQRKKFQSRTYTQVLKAEANRPINVTHRLGSPKLLVTVIDRDGKNVKVKYKVTNNAAIVLTSPVALDSAHLTSVSQDPNARTAGQKVADMTTRFLMMIRRASVTYRQTNSLVVPGFYPEAGFMGQRRVESIYAPGYDFAFGFISEDFLQKAAERNWLSMNDSVVQPATEAFTSDFDVKVNLEPIPGLKIDLNAKRYEANTTSIQYMYEGMPETFTGSYNITQVAWATAFRSIGNAKNNYASENYENFLAYREVMAQRLQDRYAGLRYPTYGFMAEENAALAGKLYYPANGMVDKRSGDVMIPAFLAAYTGRDVNKISTNPFLGLLNILPNWRVTYDGLSRIPWVKKHFKSINLTHAYNCKYSIGGYTSFSTWVAADGADKSLGFIRDVQTNNPIPSSPYDIATVSLTEQFSPLIGLNMTMKNSMTAKVEYRKQRNLALNVTSAQLVEGGTEEFVIGLGYTIKEFDLILKLKSNKQKKIKNDLKISADVSYKDVKSILRKIEENVAQPSSGNKMWTIKVMADYVLSSKINLQLFYDRQATIPLISTSFPVSTDNFGINIKLMLTR